MTNKKPTQLKLSELKKMSNDDLAALVSQALKLKEAQKNRTLENYFDTAHQGQKDFHAEVQKHRIRYFLGSNRCLTENTRLCTMDGEVPIADISASTLYASLHQGNQVRFALGTAPFPKAKENLYRVIHEQGEFVSSAHHLVFCSDGKYRHVSDLIDNQASVLSLPRGSNAADLLSSTGGFYRQALTQDDHRLMQIASNFLCGYLNESRQCDLPLQSQEDSVLTLFPSVSGALRLFLIAYQAHCDRAHKTGLLSQGHSHHDLGCDRIPQYQFHRTFLGQFVDALKTDAYGQFQKQLCESIEQYQQFLQGYDDRHTGDEFSRLAPPSELSNTSVSYGPTLSIHPYNSKIVSVEKIGSGWVWDLHVFGSNNYLAEGCFHHNSGKSTAGFVEDLFLALGRHPYYPKWKTPCKGLVIVQDFENHGKNILEPKFSTWAPSGVIERAEKNQNGAWRKIHFKNGSTIDVLSHDQDVKVFEGGDYDFAHFDEPPPKNIYTAVWRGLVDRGGLMYMTATPLASPWLFQEYIKAMKGDELRWYVMVNIKQNASNLGEGDEKLGLKRIEQFAELLDPEERAARLDGGFVQMQGHIFKEFTREHHLIPAFDWPNNWPIYESIDPHPQKPWAVSWIGLTETGNFILISSGLFEGVIEDIADGILLARAALPIKGGVKPKIIQTLIDNSSSVPLWSRSNTDLTARRKSVKDELEAYIGPMSNGPRITVAPKNVKGKIDIFKQWLHIKVDQTKGKQSLFYAFDVPENERFVFEIENYTWDVKKGGLGQGLKDRPKKENDDVLDSIMQVALTLPSGNSQEPSSVFDKPKSVKIWQGSSWKL